MDHNEATLDRAPSARANPFRLCSGNAATSAPTKRGPTVSSCNVGRARFGQAVSLAVVCEVVPDFPAPGSIRQGAVEGRKQEAAQDHPHSETPAEVAPGECGVDVRQGQPVADIASLLKAAEDYVRDVVHAFNGRGFDGLDPNWRRGTPEQDQ
ncbi:helix-turn-helix domain-containing protein [Actinoplanes sp. CA-030573]|uniref:helix-turn-helix domain-containing protein n=1 Tax=Actinoplanes sp. CA-030573 TaxID=3239898 RepID=UPI003D89D621